MYNAANILFHNFEAMQLLADGFKVALLGETRQEGLHAVVELVFIVELEKGEKEEAVRATTWERAGFNKGAKHGTV